MELSADLVIAAGGGDTTGLVPDTRLINTTAPLTGGGDLSADRTIAIAKATGAVNGYLAATDWTIFNAKMDNPMTALGDIIVGAGSGVPSLLVIGLAGTVLHGGATPSYSAVVEGDLSLSNITTFNATTGRHGFLPQLSGNSGQYLDGGGSWSTPAGGVTAAYTSVSFTGQTSVTVTHNFGAYPVVQVFDNTGAALVPLTIVNSSVNAFTVTFAVSTTGTIIATLGSPQRQNVVVTAISYLITTANRIVRVSAAGVTITMPTAVAIDGAEFIVDNASIGNITVVPQAGQTIEGEVTQIMHSNSAMHIYSDGVGWRIY